MNLTDYLNKMRGGASSPPRVSTREVLWSWLGSFLGIAAVALVNQHWLEGTDLVLIIGSFGATAVLIYGAIRSPLAQPRNLLGGHLLSAVVGVACSKMLEVEPWLAASAAVSVAIALMHLTKTLHPPGGATALIAVIGGPKIQALGWLYIFVPVGAGVLMMLIVALIVNNLAAQRRYPEFWY
ncbi:MAG: HPP family protein [Deltaproteobacteria bacterium]|nr:HPP family protein [Deltaproteobacteria bacterium]